MHALRMRAMWERVCGGPVSFNNSHRMYGHFHSVVVEFAIIYFICCYCCMTVSLASLSSQPARSKHKMFEFQSEFQWCVSLERWHNIFPRNRVHRVLCWIDFFLSLSVQVTMGSKCGVRWLFSHLYRRANKNNGRDGVAHSKTIMTSSQVFWIGLWYMARKHCRRRCRFRRRWIMIAPLNRWMRLNPLCIACLTACHAIVQFARAPSPQRGKSTQHIGMNSFCEQRFCFDSTQHNDTANDWLLDWDVTIERLMYR